MLSKLRDIVNKLLEKQLTEEERSKYELIKRIISDDDCFFKINADTACNIISDLGFNREDTIEIYKELISSKNF